MNWSQAGTIVATLAPTLGSLLGGLIPIPGGSMIGQTIGSAIARQFGVPATPDAVVDAIKSNPNEVVLAKLNAATEDLKSSNETIRAIYEAEALLIARTTEAVNITMRAELPNQHWFFTGWRATAGWIFDIAAAALGGVLIYASLLTATVSNEPLKALSDAWPIYASYLGILAAMVGVYVVGRSQEKIKAIETVKK